MLHFYGLFAATLCHALRILKTNKFAVVKLTGKFSFLILLIQAKCSFDQIIVSLSEVRFVHAVTAGGSVKFLPAV